MKNKIFVLLIYVALGVIGMTSCKDVTTEGFTDITYYPKLTVLGEETVLVNKGDSYQDAGATADLNGEDVSDEIETVSDVNTAEAGVYSVNYKIVNPDGFAVTASRTVYVADPTPSPIRNGVHTTLDGTFRFWLSSSAIVNFSGFDVTILQIEPGVFYITDFMGGYYDQRVGYGSNFAMGGTFRVNEDNTITLLTSYVPGWSDSADYLKDGTVDPVTGQITYKLGYAALMEYTIFID